ncbi:MAG: phosphotransferase enzyme family protein, partial [Nocardioides sp.]
SIASAMADALSEWVHQIVGEHSMVEVSPQTVHKAASSQRVVEILGSTGSRWFAKQVADAKSWRAEVHAYRNWVPALSGHAPSLRAADADLSTILVTALPGGPVDTGDAEVHHRAGELLRRLHHSRPARPRRSPVTGGATKLAGVLQRHSTLFSPWEIAFVRGCAEGMSRLPITDNVACHGDYRPHNWLVDDAGVVRVVDFGDAKWAVAASEFAGLFYGPWWEDRALAAVFFDGYGRSLDENEWDFVRRRVALTAVMEIAFGHTQETAWKIRRGQSRLADLISGYRVSI